MRFADLVVVLREDDELLAVARLRRPRRICVRVRRVLAGVEIAGGERAGEIARAAEAGVVAVAFVSPIAYGASDENRRTIVSKPRPRSSFRSDHARVVLRLDSAIV